MGLVVVVDDSKMSEVFGTVVDTTEVVVVGLVVV